MRIEKRRVPRTLIKIKIDYESEGAYLYNYSRDLSEGGIFIQTSNPLKIGDRLTLNFILPEVLEKIEATGEVTWINPPGAEDLLPGMGVRFMELPEDKCRSILDVINKIEGGKGLTSIED